MALDRANAKSLFLRGQFDPGHQLMKTSLQVRPPWRAQAELPEFAPLAADVQTDVCVIGAGIAGLTTAYLLRRAGLSVVVLEANSLGGGETSHTTAHLSSVLDDRFAVLERIHGAEAARLAAASHAAAIDRIQALVEAEEIHCDFQRVDGYLFRPPNESHEILDRERDAARRAGLQVEYVPRAPMAFHTGPCLRFPNQGQIQPLQYLAGLARAVSARGGQIFVGTRAHSVEGGSPAKVQTPGGLVTANRGVVVATNSPFIDRVTIHTKQAPYHTYVVGLAVPAGSVERVLYWDTADPYHYVRLQSNYANGRDLLIVGGEDHKAGQAADQWERFERLTTWAREHFPMIEEVVYRWSGQVMETIDGLAFIGRNPGDAPNVYIATGDSGMGMTHGTIAGMLLTDLITGNTNPWADLYAPSRKPVLSAWTFARENLNVATQYLDWFTGGDVTDTTTVVPGKGAVVRRGLLKVAVYRDEHGTATECSAVCPHLGCIVAWNDIEKTWDCPCHGSRFHADGTLRNGPAMTGLHRH